MAHKKNVPVHKHVRVKIVAPDLQASTKFHITEHIFDFGSMVGARSYKYPGGPAKHWFDQPVSKSSAMVSNVKPTRKMEQCLFANIAEFILQRYA